MVGYKVFNPDWTCRGFQYKVGESYEMDRKPRVCQRGFHFCIKASDCFDFYSFSSDNKVAEVEAYGDINKSDDELKYCTNKIRIVREIPWDEMLHIVNEGKGCTGFSNTGDYNTGNHNGGNYNTGSYNTGDRNTSIWNAGDCNTGNRNTGNCNMGNYNTGNWNTGSWNTGNWNMGNRNTGNRNKGSYNTGDWNKGSYNTGDWNISSFSTGCFNIKIQKMIMFEKPCDWAFEDWLHSPARCLLNQIKRNVVEWVRSSNMTDEEKKAHPSHETTGGYLRRLDESECAQLWWDDLREADRQVILNLPNFDADIFEKCTGIRV